MKYEQRYLLDFIYWILIIGIGGTMFLIREEMEDVCMVLFVPFLIILVLMVVNWYKAKKQKNEEKK